MVVIDSIVICDAIEIHHIFVQEIVTGSILFYFIFLSIINKHR